MVSTVAPNISSTYRVVILKGYDKPYTISMFTLAVAIIITNVKVLCLYCWKKRHLLSILHNRILLSLSICDLITGCSVMLSVASHYINIRDRTYRILLDMLTTFLVKAAILHLCGIAADRYLSLFLALRYRSLVTVKRVSVYIAASWGLPIALSLLTFSWLYKVIANTGTETEIQDIEIWYSIVSFCIFVAMPMMFLGWTFACMFIEIRRLLHSTPHHHSTGELSPRKRRLIYVFSFMYLSFVVLAMPYFILRLWNDVHHWSSAEEKLSNSHVVAVRASIVLKALVSFVNPLLYAYSSPELRLISAQARKKLSTSSLTACQRVSNRLSWRPSFRFSQREESILNKKNLDDGKNDV